MAVQFLLYIICVLLISIFWELSRINSYLRKAFPRPSEASFVVRPKEQAAAERG